MGHVRTLARRSLPLALLLMTAARPTSADGLPNADAAAVAPVGQPDQGAMKNAITDIPGVRVGHFENLSALKGVTVVLTEDGAEAGVDVRGSAPGTRETDLLNPINLVQRVNAVVLSGGSAYGLGSAQGVMDYLEGRGKGYAVGPNQVVPIVPAAILFDLGVGAFDVRPTADWGRQAAMNASEGPPAQGNVGAGAGATVGKMPRGLPLKGGLGTASLDLGNGVMVGAIVAVNGVGDVVNPRTGHFYAEPFVAGPLPSLPAPVNTGLAEPDADPVVVGDLPPVATNTTIAVVATNGRFSKTEMTKIAQMAHDGVARAIRPAHTMFDGDTVFAVSAGGDARVDADVSAVGAGAADALSQAIVNAILNADSIPGFPSFRERLGK